MTKPVRFSMYKAYPPVNPSITGVKMQQPVEVVLSLGYIF
jgi:hypothetical protein